MKKKFLITGSAGFIGYHLSLSLLKKGFKVVGIDNLNNYYSVKIKKDRNQELRSYKNYKFYKIDINDEKKLDNIFIKEKFDIVINLAAQAGVRYSLVNPKAYINTNINGFFKILEASKNHKVKHFLFASSSSVYGANIKQPFSEKDTTDHPTSLYGATKKSNEVIAHSYSYVYNLPVSGLRFFTVYGPSGRPDMSLFLFVDAISKNKNVNLFNYGNMSRSFTYIDKVVDGVIKIAHNPPKIQKKHINRNINSGTSVAPYEIFNLGNPKEIRLKNYLKIIQKKLNKKGKIKLKKMQIGDVKSTKADIKKFVNKFNFTLQYEIEQGIENFVKWYKSSKIK